jgi:hypothetical protein
MSSVGTMSIVTYEWTSVKFNSNTDDTDRKQATCRKKEPE